MIKLKCDLIKNYKYIVYEGEFMEISDRLRVLREEQGYSQNDLAEKLNISRQSISKWELGKSTPDITYFIKLSEIYNITLDELIKGKEFQENIKDNIKNNEFKEDKVLMDNESKIYNYELEKEDEFVDHNKIKVLNDKLEKESKGKVLGSNNMEEEILENKKKDKSFKQVLKFFKDDFVYRHTNPELVKIKTIAWLIIIGIILIIVFIRG